jgi:MATE family multidrug resistance protein
MSTTGVVAQAVGRGDFKQVAAMWRNSACLALTLATLFLLLSTPIWSLAESLVKPSEAVGRYAYSYFSIRIWSAPAALINLATLGCLLGMQKARGPMILLVVTNLVNIGLDLVFVVELKMDVAGAALASVVSDYVGLALGMELLGRALASHNERLFGGGLKLEAQAVFKLLRLNLDIFLRSLALQLCFSLMTLQGARYGDDVVAANAVLLNLLVFVSFALDGFAYAIEALCGKALGARAASEFRRVLHATLVLAVVTSGLFSLVFALLGEAVIALLTDIETIRAVAVTYLPWMMVLPMISVWCFIFDGVYIAAMAGRVMRNAMLICAVGVYLPVWWLATPMGNHGLWLALCCFMAARGLTLGWHYMRRHHVWFDAQQPCGAQAR